MLDLHSLEDSQIMRALTSEIDKKISSIIYEVGLDKNTNKFFTKARKLPKISILGAFKIAYNWREITRTFLFTTIKGLARLAEKIENDLDPKLQLLSVLQTTFNIISDDLNNNHPFLKKDAPHGPNGIHYKWWDETILNRFRNKVDWEVGSLTFGTTLLIQKMQQLSKNFLGVAVQLRVVESIALDICETFLTLFSSVEYDGKKIFENEKDLVWITSHIQAEEIHHEQVCNNFSGMANIAITLDEQRDLLKITHEYANAWNDALVCFANFIEIS